MKLRWLLIPILTGLAGIYLVAVRQGATAKQRVKKAPSSGEAPFPSELATVRQIAELPKIDTQPKTKRMVKRVAAAFNASATAAEAVPQKPDVKPLPVTSSPDGLRREYVREKLSYISAAETAEKQTSAVVVDTEKKWLNHLSGLQMRQMAEKEPAEPQCNEWRCPLKERKEVNVFGIVVNSDELKPLEGTIEQGSYLEKTPAVYVK